MKEKVNVVININKIKLLNYPKLWIDLEKIEVDFLFKVKCGG